MRDLYKETKIKPKLTIEKINAEIVMYSCPICHKVLIMFYVIGDRIVGREKPTSCEHIQLNMFR